MEKGGLGGYARKRKRKGLKTRRRRKKEEQKSTGEISLDESARRGWVALIRYGTGDMRSTSRRYGERGGGSRGWSSLPRLDRGGCRSGYIRVARWRGLASARAVRGAAARREKAGRLVAEVHVVPAGSSESRACHGPHGGPCACACAYACAWVSLAPHSPVGSSRASFDEVEPKSESRGMLVARKCRRRAASSRRLLARRRSENAGKASEWTNERRPSFSRLAHIHTHTHTHTHIYIYIYRSSQRRNTVFHQSSCIVVEHRRERRERERKREESPVRRRCVLACLSACVHARVAGTTGGR